MTDEKRAELLMDHYKDTFSILREHWRARNRLFMYALVLIAIVALDSITVKLIQPEEGTVRAQKGKGEQHLLSSLVNDLIKARLKATDRTLDPIDFPIIDMMARFLLLCLVIQYYQRSVLVDRQYRYLHNLESNLCSLLGGNFVTREGKSYFSRTGVPSEFQKEKRPVFLRSVGKLYVYVFPGTLILLMACKLISTTREFFGIDLFSKNFLIGVVSALLSIAIVFYNVLYLYWQVWESRSREKS